VRLQLASCSVVSCADEGAGFATPTRRRLIEAVRAALLELEQPHLLIERERNFLLVPDEKTDPT